MPQEDHVDALVRFFKVLAEPNRLKIVGLLARKPASVEQISSALGVGVSTASHHLSRLAKAGLVSARAEGYYSIYSLETAALTAMAKKLLHKDDLPRLAPDESLNAFERKVLTSFMTRDGRIRAFPVQEKKFLVLLRYVLREFKVGVRYSEKRVNEILGHYHDDTARLRRNLVEYGFMAREGGGGKYWRVQ